MSIPNEVENAGSKKREMIDIKQLIIKLKTNIPGKENVEFTRDILYNPSLIKDTVIYLNNYPFITTDYEFKTDIISYNYNDIYAFFFNKKIFVNKLRGNLYGKFKKYTDPKNDKEKEPVLEHNINILLQALFPLHSKVSEGYINAYEKNSTSNPVGSTLFNSMKNKMNMKDMYKYLFSLFKNLNYTCLDMGEKYTITRVIWLNDTKTNPIFKEFLRDYRKLKNWIDTQNTDIQKAITSNTFDTNYSDFNKNYGYKTINNPKNPFNDTSTNYNKDEYMNYNDFYTMIKQKSQLRNILNTDIKDKLDGVISKYIDPKQVANFYNYMDELYKKKENIIGFKSLSKNGYEINVLMDCIKGEITNENFNKIKCNYNSNKLGDLIEYKLNKFDDDAFDEVFFKNNKFNNRKLYSINDNKTIEQPNKGENNNKQPYNARVGGKKIRTSSKLQHKFENHKKTRKNI